MIIEMNFTLRYEVSGVMLQEFLESSGAASGDPEDVKTAIVVKIHELKKEMAVEGLDFILIGLKVTP